VKGGVDIFARVTWDEFGRYHNVDPESPLGKLLGIQPDEPLAPVLERMVIMEPATREAAAADVDRLLDAWYTPAIDGRCPLCEAIVTAEPLEPDQEHRETLDPGQEREDWNYVGLKIEHSDDCALKNARLAVDLLAERWGFEFEDVRAVRRVGGRPAFFMRKRRIPD
jgi:hypothetical protein